ncbi:Rrf2 family transcriptional regulator [Amphibacillus cookii]|uniref:Rrf2 family transcriptional regulator n=1 Tax=Amphibacillus cookii TaxID=767787 RepID=UPI0019591C36|nr:Rrf2 family transcriptional regulator [Amphibacillus cookii]MBM7542597.1 Rrf2 family protein [Amphibacillus cookii]
MINTKLSVAIHILTLIATNPHDPVTSESIAKSVNTNPVVIRRLSGQLKQAGLISSQAGKPGFTLLKAPGQITILTVYQALQTKGDLFLIHPDPNPNCWVGKNIQSVLETTYKRAQDALEQELAQQTLANIIKQLTSH